MAISFSKASFEKVMDFWHDSPHATVFTHPEVMAYFFDRVDWWMAWKGQEPICLWPVCMPNGQDIDLPGFTYYIGPMWSHKAFYMPAHRWLTRSRDVYEGFIRVLLAQYGLIYACLPIGLFDIRVFDWWNYHEVDKPRFRIMPRYTACIYNLQSMNDHEIVASFREVRRQELKQMEKIGPPVRIQKWTVDDIISLYKSVMKRQKINVDGSIVKDIVSLVNIVNKGYGEVIAYKENHSKKVIAVLLLLYGKGVANMVLNLVEDTWRPTGLPAWMVYNSIMAAKAKGATCFDFNGANSPNRGDDKHSYGSSPILYFEIRYPD